MAEITVKIRVRVAWWVRPYIASCMLFARLNCLKLDSNKISFFIAVHGVKLELVNG